MVVFSIIKEIKKKGLRKPFYLLREVFEKKEYKISMKLYLCEKEQILLGFSSFRFYREYNYVRIPA